MKKGPFKMKKFSGFGNSPARKELKGTTIFGHEASKIKDKIVKKVKKVGRKAELLFESGIYSNKYQAENPGRFKNSKINQPRFKEEKKKLLER